MAASDLATRDVAQAGQRRVGQGQGRAGEASGAHPAVAHERQGESLAAVVRQQSRPNDSDDPWPGGVPDGIAAHGRGAEADREGGPEGKVEMQHSKRIDRSYGIAAKEVTVEQFLRFRMAYAYNNL
jgi:hypothetical protein